MSLAVKCLAWAEWSDGFLILTEFLFALNIVTTALGAYTMKSTDGQAVGLECEGCHRIFPTLYQYDQHRRSPFLRGTNCYAIPASNKTELTAAPRPNKTIAAVEPRMGHRMRGKRQNIFCRHCILNHILHIIHARRFCENLEPWLSAAGRPVLRCIFPFFSIF